MNPNDEKSYQKIEDGTPLINEKQKKNETTTTTTTTEKTTRTARILSKIGNPFPKSLNKSCLEAAEFIETFLEHSQEQVIIPEESIRECKGLLIVNVAKAGYIWTGRLGSGLVIAKNENGTGWCPPLAVNMIGVGYGFQVGLEVSHLVFILRDEHSLNSMLQRGNLSIGANASLSLGPLGRSVEVDLPVTCSLMYTISKSQGLFAGISLEVTLWLHYEKANHKFYGKKVSIHDIIKGNVEYPKEAVILIDALERRFPLSLHSSTTPSTTASMTPIYSHRNSNNNIYSQNISINQDSNPQQQQQQPLYPPIYAPQSEQKSTLVN